MNLLNYSIKLICFVYLAVLVAGCINPANGGQYPYAPKSSHRAAFSYVGCFVDAEERALPNAMIDSGATVESCIAAAQAGGFAYAGVQYGGQCFAGNRLEFSQTNSSDCNMPCSANPDEICGGSWRNSIYSTGVRRRTSSHIASLGCYIDTPDRALPNQLIESGATVKSCIAAARAEGFAYAGVQYGGQCFAGNSLGFSRTNSNDCNMPCNANPREICGGSWRNSIYSTGIH